MNPTSARPEAEEALTQASSRIEEAEAGDAARLDAWMEALKRPFDEQPGADRFAARRPEWAKTRPGCATLSCSS